MSTPDPFGDALNSQAAASAGGDDYGNALAAQAASKTEDQKQSPRRAIGDNVEDLAHNFGSSIYHSVVGGYKGLYDLATGQGSDAAAKDVQDEQAKIFQVPERPQSPNVSTAAREAIRQGTTLQPSTGLGDWASNRGAGPGLSTALAVLPSAAASFMMPGRNAPASEVAPEVASEAPLTATGAPRGAYSEIPDGDVPTFPSKAPSANAGGSLPSAEQSSRQAILQRVGINEARVSALEGDPSDASTDYQVAKLDNPAGRRMKAVIDSERQALSDHADNIVDGTGGTPGSAMDESTRLERGQNIIKPIDDLKDYFDSRTKALYDQANERAQGAPQPLSKFQDLLGDDSQMTNSDRVQLRTALNSYLGKLKMMGEDGTISGNPMQAETVRKYLNENWSPQNGRLVGKLKDALDDDVTQAAGSDIYAEARAMRTLRGNTLDNPNGIAKLMDSSGPSGINRAVPTEKIADTVTSMPVAQLDHVIKTLKGLPPELQESGNAALAEIKAHMASKIADAGQSTQSMWNAKGVNQFLSKNSAKLPLLFDAEELGKLGDLNDAGNILRKDQSYPGAAVQEHNLLQRGAMAAIRSGATAAGAHFGPLGAVAGETIGGKLAGKYEAASALKNVEARIRPISPTGP